ncbi:MAG TPA: hypothetical protein DCG34_08825 [Clostridiales bacterium]|jgi:hypothetical protein|nr:hypothetical protein [Clostridiales bacterium]
MAKSNWLILGAIILLIAIVGNPMTMISTDRTVQLPVGQTVDVPFKYTYDNGAFLGSSTTARIVCDYKGYSHPDIYPLTWAVTQGTTYEQTFPLQVQGTVGTTYTIVVEVQEKNGGSWVSSSNNKFTLHVTVVEPTANTDDKLDKDLGELGFDSILLGASSIGFGLVALLLVFLIYRRKNE